MARSGAYFTTPPPKPSETLEMVQKRTYDLALSIYENAVKLSPVDSGTFKSLWRMSYDNPLYVWSGRRRPNPGAKIPYTNKYFTKIFVANGAPYASVLESGHSNQSPNGVLEPAIRMAKSRTR